MDDLTPLRQAVRHDSDISMSASCMFEDICDMHEAGECWAEDSHFADQYDVHEETVARWRRALVNHGYLREESDGDRRLLVPNNKIVVGQQKECSSTDSSREKDCSTTNSSPQNRCPQSKDIPAEASEGAPARAEEAPISEDKAVEVGQMIGISERLCREWWLYHDEKGWEKNIRNVKSALRRWKMNDRRFNGGTGGGGSGDGAAYNRELRMSEEEKNLTLDDLRKN